MSTTTTVASAEAEVSTSTIASTSRRSGPDGVERRRRKRAKISAQVHVRVESVAESFEEVCSSIDVSRDGLLFIAKRTNYSKGQLLQVTFPYSPAASALNQPQNAEVVRASDYGAGLLAVAVQFQAAKSVAKEAASDPSMAGAEDSSAREKQATTVLAVESDQRAADTMRNLLQQDGYNVIVVPTARAALEVLKTTIPSVFLAEVEGDDMSGHDLCLIIKRNERLQHVPVILMTRSAQPADYSASHQLGAVVCMAKPFKPERLLHVVRLVAPPKTQKSVYGTRVQGSAIERSF
ncbi:MAG TPA: response regulator [Candidatus Limnocylindrales bacterium]|nr:response regulator [Candidatus Limnocylindrales bacterium]